MTYRDSLERIQSDINTFTALERNHYIPETERREDDTSHSYSVLMTAWRLHDAVQPTDLSLKKILAYAAIHDFVEIHAGDVNTFAPADARASKVQAEQDAIDQIRRAHMDWPELAATIETYEAQNDEESRFVWACDKIQSLNQGQLDNWRCYYEYGVTNDMFAAKLDDYCALMPQILRPVFRELAIHWVETYDIPLR